MSWWDTLVDGVSTIAEYFSYGAKWIWTNIPLSRMTKSTLNYVANTSVQFIDQAVALRTAIPSLIYNPASRKVLNSMSYIVVHDVLPVVGVNYINNSIQNYFRQKTPAEALPWFSAYTGLLTALNVADYAVRAYTLRQSAEALTHITLVDVLGPAAFNQHKKTKQLPSLCSTEKCTKKRQYKGGLREPLILLSNDLVTSGVSYIPYVGKPISLMLSTIFAGRYITRLVTPERCERHKAMMQESVLALGLSYKASMFIMDNILKATVGMPPFMYYRTLQHLMLLLHINTAAHMTIPLITAEQTTISIDLFNAYEATSRFFADVIFEGLIKRIPIDIKFDPNARPLIPLSTALQYGTRLLKNDMEKEVVPKPGFFSSSLQTIRIWVTPNLFHSQRQLINDPIIKQYWPQIRTGAIESLEVIQQAGQSKIAATIALAPNAVAKAVKLTTGIPKNITKLVLMLSQDSDFWDFMKALKLWFEQHDLNSEVVLATSDKVSLNGEKPLLPLPSSVTLEPVHPSNNLIPIKPQEVVLDAQQILSDRKQNDQPQMTYNSSVLFSTRTSRRNKQPLDGNEKQQNIQSVLNQHYF